MSSTVVTPSGSRSWLPLPHGVRDPQSAASWVVGGVTPDQLDPRGFPRAGPRLGELDEADRQFAVLGYRAHRLPRVVDARDAGGAGDAVRALVGAQGTDAAIELSGSYRALHEAIRTVGVDGLVVASGFYQGEGLGLRLGEEFHHNRVRIVGSQIGRTPLPLGLRWNQRRLIATVLHELAVGRLRVAPLTTDVLDAEDVGEASPGWTPAPPRPCRSCCASPLLPTADTSTRVARPARVDGRLQP
jgi:hypothetical protein